MSASANKETDSRQFLEGLYQNYHRLMYQTACKWLETAADREDLVQEALVKLIEKEELLRTLKKESLVCYIVHTVRNTAFKHLNKRKNTDALLTELEEDGPAGEPPVDDRLLREEQFRHLRQAWSALPEREKLLLEGRYLFGESDEELAQALGCKPGSVRMALTRARRELLKQLEEVER